MSRLLLDAGDGFFVVFWIDFAGGEVDSVVVRGDGVAAASKVRVQYPLAWLRVASQQPFIELHRLLRGVEPIQLIRRHFEDSRRGIHGHPREFHFGEAAAIH